MVKVIEHNVKYNYKIYDISTYVNPNLDALKYASNLAYTKYLKNFQDHNSSSTRGSKFYNLFSLTAGSRHLHEIFKSIKFGIFDFLGTNTEDLYMQAWINYDKYDQVLDWHTHSSAFLCNGYISIDPKNSTTEFEGYSIVNKPGLMYIGPSNRVHRIVVNEPYPDNRVTIAFDVINLDRFVEMGLKFTNQHCSFIPL